MDTLSNLVAGLFSGKDKLAHDRFLLVLQDRGQLDSAYRGDWIARKVVDVPPFDMTREWRRWHADPAQIAAIEAEEVRLGVQRKVARALRLARLYGGAALVLGAGDGDPARPLPPLGRAGLRYLHVMHRWEITPGEIDRDVLSPGFGEPAWYQVVSAAQGGVRLHPSRVVRLAGAELPDEAGADGWGDSVLQAVMDAVRQAGLAAQGVAMLIHEAKLDVIRIPQLTQNLAQADYARRLVDRFTLANTMKGLSDADYRQTAEFRQNGARFDVFSAPEWGIRALAVLLISYQNRHGLRTIRDIIARWAPSAEVRNDTGAYVDHVSALTGFGPDQLLDLHSYAHMAPLVRAIITHENGRCVYSQAVIDDGLFRAGVKPPGKVVTSKAANVAKTAAVAGGGGIALVGAVSDGLQQAAPAIPIIRDIASLPWWLLAAGSAAALIAVGVWLVLRRR